MLNRPLGFELMLTNCAGIAVILVRKSDIFKGVYGINCNPCQGHSPTAVPPITRPCDFEECSSQAATYFCDAFKMLVGSEVEAPL